jgi:hypothetical protein
MSTIRKREHHDGTFTCQAMIRIKRKGQIVYHESKTFWKCRSALSWAKRRELELEDPSMLAAARAGSNPLAGSSVGTSTNSTRSLVGNEPNRAHWSSWSGTKLVRRICIDCQHLDLCSMCARIGRRELDPLSPKPT